jgi:hypothetical protein
MTTQLKLHEMFEYRNDGNLIHKHTVQGGKQKGAVAGSPHNAGYRQICIDYKKHLIHRLVWLYHYGEMPTQIDHINGNRSDNRIENLRECTYSQNHGNRKMSSSNTSGYKGVFLDKRDGFWFVYIASEYKGRYRTAQEAADAYDMFAKEHFGKFALTNKEIKNVRKTN